MKKSLLKRKELQPWLLLAPAIIIVSVFMLFPLIDNIRISFLNYNLMNPTDQYFNNFANYIKLFEDENLLKVTLNSLKWCGIVVSLQFFFGMLLALLINRKFVGRPVYQSLIFVPWAIASFLIGLMFRWIFTEHAGILNSVLMSIGMISKPISWLSDPNLVMIGPIVAIVWYGIPFFGIMILAALQSIPNEIMESAQIDGANTMQRYFKITLPYIKPTIITTILLRIIWVFNSPDIIYMMTQGGPNNSSNILSLYVYNQAFLSLDFGYAAAVSNIIVVGLLIFAVIFLRITKYGRSDEM